MNHSHRATVKLYMSVVVGFFLRTVDMFARETVYELSDRSRGKNRLEYDKKT